MSVTVDALQAAWRFYKTGIVRAGDDCGQEINHGAVIVGYTEKVDPECHIHRWWSNCPETHDKRRRLQDASGHHNYWKLVNSWGTDWGDEGFIRLEITEGKGVCGMNRWI